jgi:type I restriction enzyme S subunit
MLAESRSGTFPQITFDHLTTVEIFVPKDKDILESITNIFKDIVTKTFSNHIAIKTLENMRDTLLPKLMSGEVRVEI